MHGPIAYGDVALIFFLLQLRRLQDGQNETKCQSFRASLRFLRANANTILGSQGFDVAFHDLKNKLYLSTP